MARPTQGRHLAARCQQGVHLLLQQEQEAHLGVGPGPAGVLLAAASVGHVLHARLVDSGVGGRWPLMARTACCRPRQAGRWGCSRGRRTRFISTKLPWSVSTDLQARCVGPGSAGAPSAPRSRGHLPSCQNSSSWPPMNSDCELKKSRVTPAGAVREAVSTSPLPGRPRATTPSART